MIEDQTNPYIVGEKGQERLSKKGVIWFFIVQCLTLVIAIVVLMGTGEYGFSLFCVVPFSIGITIGAYTARFKTKRLLRGTFITLIVVCGLSLLLVGLGLEGAICITMAMGLIVLPVFLGALIGYWIRNVHRTYVALLIVVLNSSFVTYDYINDNGVKSIAEESVIITASREKIWHVLTHGVQFHPNTNVFFEAGVNYPTSMRLQYNDDKTCFLMCTLNTGNASLEIEKIDSLKSIRFKVPEGVVSMTELSVYDSIEAPHLQGYFKPMFGEFSIEEVNASQCRLVARTSYSYKITPAFYWQSWTDYLVNAMHGHVLNDIKTLAEE